MENDNKLLQDPIDSFNNLLGGKWKMRIFQELMDGPKRFGELKRSLGKITQKVLTESLRKMEDAGVIIRTVYPEVSLRVEYSLSSNSYGLSSAVRSIISSIYTFASTSDNKPIDFQQKATFYTPSAVQSYMEKDRRIAKAKQIIRDADIIVIGTGSGINTATGIDYFSKSLSKKWFPELRNDLSQPSIDELISRYYQLRPDNINEYWYFWANYINNICFNRVPSNPHINLRKIIGQKDYIAITTNSDLQLEKAGFDTKRLYTPLGNYAYLQCAYPCDFNVVYPAFEYIQKILAKLDAGIKLTVNDIPRCPTCGYFLVPNHFRTKTVSVARSDNYMTRTQFFNRLIELRGKKVAFLEIGCGFTLPNIIRFPFEKYVKEIPGANLIRINTTYPNLTDKEIIKNTIIIRDDIIQSVKNLVK